MSRVCYCHQPQNCWMTCRLILWSEITIGFHPVWKPQSFNTTCLVCSAGRNSEFLSGLSRKEWDHQLGRSAMGVRGGSVSTQAATGHTCSGKVSTSLISLQRIWTSFWRADHADVVPVGTAMDPERLWCPTHTPPCWIVLFSMSMLFFGTLLQLKWLA